MVPSNGTGKAKPPASGGIVDSPEPLITSTVLLPNPIKIGAADTTVGPLRMIPVENGINPPLPVSPVAPVAPVGPVGPTSPVAPVAPVGPTSPVAPVAPVGPWPQ